ncbi:aspartate/glutamate racemase family protein [Ramlibacter henchirensis]|uniref:Aspartate/glutamate racemase family protein n=2 Tax=Ramlibacter henchirensis TaxID=204072 RepID=A0A4Z0CBH6_9BURK|nr:aspartate/glutamate racemase family protein [Ramlibacter henchirensis]
MLDTRFPRLPGDVGHPQCFGGAVRHAVIQGAVPRRVVADAQALRDSGLAAPFIEAARALAAQGARAITTSCGFLVLLQDELQAAVPVPVVTSSLLQLPGLLASEPQVGVLTISSQRLGPDHLLAAGVPRERLADVIVQGVDAAGPFASAILGNQPDMDVEGACADVVNAARALRERAPHLRTAVLECTNMPPHAAAASQASGLRLLSLLDDERLRR